MKQYLSNKGLALPREWICEEECPQDEEEHGEQFYNHKNIWTKWQDTIQGNWKICAHVLGSESIASVS